LPEESVDDQLIKQIVDEFERTLSVVVFDALQERRLLAAAVDTQVKKEFGIEMVDGKPIGEVPAEVASDAEMRHAHLFAEAEKECARRLNALKLDPEAAMGN